MTRTILAITGAALLSVSMVAGASAKAPPCVPSTSSVFGGKVCTTDYTADINNGPTDSSKVKSFKTHNDTATISPRPIRKSR